MDIWNTGYLAGVVEIENMEFKISTWRRRIWTYVIKDGIWTY
jgi:hypothetical protein